MFGIILSHRVKLQSAACSWVQITVCRSACMIYVLSTDSCTTLLITIFFCFVFLILVIYRLYSQYQMKVHNFVLQKLQKIVQRPHQLMRISLCRRANSHHHHGPPPERNPGLLQLPCRQPESFPLSYPVHPGGGEAALHCVTGLCHSFTMMMVFYWTCK